MGKTIFDFTNKYRAYAMLTGHYWCGKCGGEMIWEDECEDVLVCPSCGWSCFGAEYGEPDEGEHSYEELYGN